MRTFIKNVLLFCLPAFCLLTIADYTLSKVLEKAKRDQIVAWYDLMHGAIDADVIVMGNSRAFIHVNPLILDSILGRPTYNIGMDGSPTNRQIRKYHIFRKYNRKPLLIIQNIDFCTIDAEGGYKRYQFFPYFWNKDVRDEYFDYEPFTAGEKYMPMCRYIRQFASDPSEFIQIFNDSSNTLIKGWESREDPWDRTQLDHITSISFQASDTNLATFEQYLAEAKREGIKVVLFYAPLYIEATKKLENMEEMQATYRRIADKYDIPILDFTNMAISADTTYFYNAMHLNKRGATIFSDSLACAIKQLRLLD